MSPSIIQDIMWISWENVGSYTDLMEYIGIQPTTSLNDIHNLGANLGSGAK